MKLLFNCIYSFVIVFFIIYFDVLFQLLTLQIKRIFGKCNFIDSNINVTDATAVVQMTVVAHCIATKRKIMYRKFLKHITHMFSLKCKTYCSYIQFLSSTMHVTIVVT